MYVYQQKRGTQRINSLMMPLKKCTLWRSCGNRSCLARNPGHPVYIPERNPQDGLQATFFLQFCFPFQFKPMKCAYINTTGLIGYHSPPQSRYVYSKKAYVIPLSCFRFQRLILWQHCPRVIAHRAGAQGFAVLVRVSSIYPIELKLAGIAC